MKLNKEIMIRVAAVSIVLISTVGCLAIAFHFKINYLFVVLTGCFGVLFFILTELYLRLQHNINSLRRKLDKDRIGLSREISKATGETLDELKESRESLFEGIRNEVKGSAEVSKSRQNELIGVLNQLEYKLNSTREALLRETKIVSDNLDRENTWRQDQLTGALKDSKNSLSGELKGVAADLSKELREAASGLVREAKQHEVRLTGAARDNERRQRDLVDALNRISDKLGQNKNGLSGELRAVAADLVKETRQQQNNLAERLKVLAKIQKMQTEVKAIARETNAQSRGIYNGLKPLSIKSDENKNRINEVKDLLGKTRETMGQIENNIRQWKSLMDTHHKGQAEVDQDSLLVMKSLGEILESLPAELSRSSAASFSTVLSEIAQILNQKLNEYRRFLQHQNANVKKEIKEDFESIIKKAHMSDDETIITGDSGKDGADIHYQD